MALQKATNSEQKWASIISDLKKYPHKRLTKEEVIRL